MPTQPPEMTPAEAKQVIIEYLRDGETPITDVVSAMAVLEERMNPATFAFIEDAVMAQMALVAFGEILDDEDEDELDGHPPFACCADCALFPSANGQGRIEEIDDDDVDYDEEEAEDEEGDGDASGVDTVNEDTERVRRRLGHLLATGSSGAVHHPDDASADAYGVDTVNEDAEDVRRRFEELLDISSAVASRHAEEGGADAYGVDTMNDHAEAVRRRFAQVFHTGSAVASHEAEEAKAAIDKNGDDKDGDHKDTGPANTDTKTMKKTANARAIALENDRKAEAPAEPTFDPEVEAEFRRIFAYDADMKEHLGEEPWVQPMLAGIEMTMRRYFAEEKVFAPAAPEGGKKGKAAATAAPNLQTAVLEDNHDGTIQQLLADAGAASTSKSKKKRKGKNKGGAQATEVPTTAGTHNTKSTPALPGAYPNVTTAANANPVASGSKTNSKPAAKNITKPAAKSTTMPSTRWTNDGAAGPSNYATRRKTDAQH